MDGLIFWMPTTSPLMHHAHKTQTACAHPISNSSQIFDTARAASNRKNSKMKMEKPRDDLQGWHTQCLAHHLPGAQNTDHLVTPVVSQEAII